MDDLEQIDSGEEVEGIAGICGEGRNESQDVTSNARQLPVTLY